MISDVKAQTLAEYYEEVQWRVRVIDGSLPETPLGEVLPIEIADITMEELVAACKKLKVNNASGIDEVPAEIWKCLRKDPEHDAAKWLLRFCNLVWRKKKSQNHGVNPA